MPFTGSHPAAVLPLIRWGLPASALVIGSMTPDLPYYLPMPVSAEVTHSWVGVIGVDVLLGAVAFIVWQALVGPAVVAFSPDGLRRRLVVPVPSGLGYHVGQPRRVALAAVALILGAATHVAWDSFTHRQMWGAEHVAWLAESHGRRLGSS